MNKQAVGLSPPYLRYGRPQTPEEKAAVAARKVQRVVKKRLQRQAVAARKVQRETDREVKREVKKTLDAMVAQRDGWSKQQLFWFGDSWTAEWTAIVEEHNALCSWAAELREAKKQLFRSAALPSRAHA